MKAKSLHYCQIGVLLGALLLGACTTTGGQMAGGGRAVRPISDAPPQTAQQAKAKSNVELGVAYLGIGRYDVALDEARSALQHDSSYPPAYHLMGLVYMFIEDMQAARENLQRALSMAPNDPQFENSYGWFQCTQGNIGDGLMRLQKAVKNPYYREKGYAYTNAGMCYLMEKKDLAAQAEFLHAIETMPNNTTALFHLADIAWRQQDMILARQWLDRLHRYQEPTPASAWLGLRVARRSQDDEAEERYGSILRERFRQTPEYRAMLQEASQ